MQNLIKYLEENWFTSEKQLDTVKEQLSKLFPEQKFSFKIDWTGDKQSFDYSIFASLVKEAHTRKAIEDMVEDVEFQKELTKIISDTARKFNRGNYRRNPVQSLMDKCHLNTPFVCAELLKIDQKKSTLPRGERDVVIGLIHQTISKFASNGQ